MEDAEEEAIHVRALKARPRQARNRARALKLDNHMCRLCTFKECLEVHQIVPRAKGGSGSIGNRITLCPNHRAMARRGLISDDQFAKALGRRKSTGRSRMADCIELMEYVVRSCAAVNLSDPGEFALLVVRLTIELPRMMEIMLGPDFVSANLDYFVTMMRAAAFPVTASPGSDRGAFA